MKQVCNYMYCCWTHWYRVFVPLRKRKHGVFVVLLFVTTATCNYHKLLSLHVFFPVKKKKKKKKVPLPVNGKLFLRVFLL